MSLADAVLSAIGRNSGRDELSEVDVLFADNENLRNAEILADLFANVRPQPYVVPIERFAGMTVSGEERVPFRFGR